MIRRSTIGVLGLMMLPILVLIKGKLWRELSLKFHLPYFLGIIAYEAILVSLAINPFTRFIELLGWSLVILTLFTIVAPTASIALHQKVRIERLLGGAIVGILLTMLIGSVVNWGVGIIVVPIACLLVAIAALAGERAIKSRFVNALIMNLLGGPQKNARERVLRASQVSRTEDESGIFRTYTYLPDPTEWSPEEEAEIEDWMRRHKE